jgi:hypothetical protein
VINLKELSAKHDVPGDQVAVLADGEIRDEAAGVLDGPTCPTLTRRPPPAGTSHSYSNSGFVVLATPLGRNTVATDVCEAGTEGFPAGRSSEGLAVAVLPTTPTAHLGSDGHGRANYLHNGAASYRIA